MKRIIQACIVALSASLPILSCQKVVEVETERPMTGVIRGRVVLIDAYHNHYPNKNQCTITAEPGHITVNADSNGFFDLPLARGVYNISVSKPGYGNVEIEGYPLYASDTIRIDTVFATIYEKQQVVVQGIDWTGLPYGTYTLDVVCSSQVLSEYDPRDARESLALCFYDRDPNEEQPTRSYEYFTSLIYDYPKIPLLAYLDADDLQDHGFTSGKTVYVQAAVINGTLYYDYFRHQYVSNALSPWSQIMKITLP